MNISPEGHSFEQIPVSDPVPPVPPPAPDVPVQDPDDDPGAPGVPVREPPTKQPPLRMHA